MKPTVGPVRPARVRTYVRALGIAGHTQDDERRLPGIGDRHPPLQRAGGAGHALPRDPHQVGPQPRPGRLAAPVRVDGEPVSRMQPCVRLLPAGDTPILLADGRTRRSRDLRVGDAIYGTGRDGRYRRYVATEVLAHWSTVKPAYRVTLADGTELVASGDHRFLSRARLEARHGHRVRPTRPAAPDAQRPLGRHRRVRRRRRSEDARLPARLPVRDSPRRRARRHVQLRAPSWTVDVVHRFRLALIDLEALRRARRVPR